MDLFRKNKFKDLTQENQPVTPVQSQVQQLQSIPSIPGSLKEPNEEYRKLLLQLIKHNEEIAKNIVETNHYILGKLESLK